MRKFMYKEDVYTEERLEELYPMLLHDCLEEGDYDDVMTFKDFSENPEKYLEEVEEMTIEEAIEQLETIIENAKDMLKDPEADSIWIKDITASEMAIEALRKQKPKKVVSVYSEMKADEKLLEEFSKHYERLYKCNDKVKGFKDAVIAFDEANNVPGFIDLVVDFAKLREDFITSDREAAAFMMALSNYGILIPTKLAREIL